MRTGRVLERHAHDLTRLVAEAQSFEAFLFNSTCQNRTPHPSLWPTIYFKSTYQVFPNCMEWPLCRAISIRIGEP